VRPVLPLPTLRGAAEDIFDSLSRRAMTVAELVEDTGRNRDTIRSTLRRLRRLGLVAARGCPPRALRWRVSERVRTAWRRDAQKEAA
jgi:DNA-binding IclR family transcriptional regulator